MTHRLIVVAATGEMAGICEITLPRIEAYAKQVNAELRVWTDMPERYQHPKYRMFEAGELYVKRILILDADILIRNGAPDASEIGDRASAIMEGVRRLKAGDALLIAGKGHETGQIVKGVTIPFSDFDVARAALDEVGGSHG